MDSSLKLLLVSLALVPLLVEVASAEAGLYLAINPLAFTDGGTADGEVVKRRVEVNWYGEQPLPDDYIELTSGSGANGPLNQTVNISASLTNLLSSPETCPTQPWIRWASQAPASLTSWPSGSVHPRMDWKRC